MLGCHKVPRLPHDEVTQWLKTPKVTTFAALPRSRAIAQSSLTVANSCGYRSGAKRTRLHPQTPKVKREPFATHSGNMWFHEVLDIYIYINIYMSHDQPTAIMDLDPAVPSGEVFEVWFGGLSPFSTSIWIHRVWIVGIFPPPFQRNHAGCTRYDTMGLFEYWGVRIIFT